MKRLDSALLFQANGIMYTNGIYSQNEYPVFQKLGLRAALSNHLRFQIRKTQ
jgi:hypothetical protein